MHICVITDVKVDDIAALVVLCSWINKQQMSIELTIVVSAIQEIDKAAALCRSICSKMLCKAQAIHVYRGASSCAQQHEEMFSYLNVDTNSVQEWPSYTDERYAKLIALSPIDQLLVQYRYVSYFTNSERVYIGSGYNTSVRIGNHQLSTASIVSMYNDLVTDGGMHVTFINNEFSYAGKQSGSSIRLQHFLVNTLREHSHGVISDFIIKCATQNSLHFAQEVLGDPQSCSVYRSRAEDIIENGVTMEICDAFFMTAILCYPHLEVPSTLSSTGDWFTWTSVSNSPISVFCNLHVDDLANTIAELVRTTE